jgi:hypothetical protein
MKKILGLELKYLFLLIAGLISFYFALDIGSHVYDELAKAVSDFFGFMVNQL